MHEQRRDVHGVGVGLGDLTGHEGEHALNNGDVQRAILGRRIIDHLVQDHLAALAHRRAPAASME